MTLVDIIEKTIGEERTQKLVNSRPYRFTVDAIAMNVFSLSYALNEKFIAGMDWTETGKARLAAAIGNTLTGRPYGIYRDYVMKKLNVTNETHWMKKYLADIFIFATGQTPLYLIYLAAAGADPDEIMKGTTFLTLVAPVTGRPQGVTYDYCRKQFGVEEPYQTNERKATE